MVGHEDVGLVGHKLGTVLDDDLHAGKGSDPSGPTTSQIENAVTACVDKAERNAPDAADDGGEGDEE